MTTGFRIPYFRFRTCLALAFLLSLGSPSAFCADGKKTMTGVYYFPGWHHPESKTNPPPKTEWNTAIMGSAEPRPLMGFYDESNPAVWEYFREWMLGSGIDFVAFDWYYNVGQEFLNGALDKGFHAQEDPKLKYCVHWCNHGGPWWLKPMDQSKPALLDMVDLLCEKHFARSDYLRIDGKPVLMIYAPETVLSFGKPKDGKRNLDAMRKRAKERGFSGLYIVCVYSATYRDQIISLRDLGYDAFTAYTYCWMRPQNVRWNSQAIPYKDTVSFVSDTLHPFLSRLSREVGFPYWPTVFPGWDDRPRAGVDKALVLTDNRPDLFGVMLRSALKSVHSRSPVVMMEAWNEWGEGAHIEPSKKYGFGYLDEIAAALGKTRPQFRAPSTAEISSWGLLSSEELQEAERNEKKPWPTPTVVEYRMGKSEETSNVVFPVVIDFRTLSADLQLCNVKILEQGPDGMIVSTTGNDPSIGFSIPDTPTLRIDEIILDAKAISGESPLPTEMFFSTALMPEHAQFAAARLPEPKGRVHVPTKNIMGWEQFGTPIKRIRLDLGAGAGNTICLKRLTLHGE